MFVPTVLFWNRLFNAGMVGGWDTNEITSNFHALRENTLVFHHLFPSTRGASPKIWSYLLDTCDNNGGGFTWCVFVWDRLFDLELTQSDVNDVLDAALQFCKTRHTEGHIKLEMLIHTYTHHIWPSHSQFRRTSIVACTTGTSFQCWCCKVMRNAMIRGDTWWWELVPMQGTGAKSHANWWTIQLATYSKSGQSSQETT